MTHVIYIRDMTHVIYKRHDYLSIKLFCPSSIRIYDLLINKTLLSYIYDIHDVYVQYIYVIYVMYIYDLLIINKTILLINKNIFYLSIILSK